MLLDQDADFFPSFTKMIIIKRECLRLISSLCVRVRSFSGLDFPSFGLKTERYEVSLLIQAKCGKIRTKKTPNTDTFNTVFIFQLIFCPKVCLRSILSTSLVSLQNN